MSPGMIVFVAIVLPILGFGAIGLVGWYFIDYVPDRKREYRSATHGQFNVEVKYNPTIRKYYIELTNNAYGTVYRSHVMTRLWRVKYYKDKNIATVESERFKGNF